MKKFIIAVFIIAILSGCMEAPVEEKKLVGINIIEETIAEVTENKIVDVEFYEDETIHYVVVDDGITKHRFMDLKTAEVTEFQGKPSPSGIQYARVDSSNKSQNLLIFRQSESEPFLRIEIPKRNEFPVLNYYWVDENTILIEGDCLWHIDIKKQKIQVIAESQTEPDNAIFYFAWEFPNIVYIDGNDEGFYYCEITGMRSVNLYFASKSGECILLDELSDAHSILFFDGKVYYGFSEWKCAENTKTFELDAKNIYLTEKNKEKILFITDKTGQLTLYASNHNSPETYQVPGDYLPGDSCYIDTSSILSWKNYFNLQTGEGVNYTWDGRLPSNRERKYFTQNTDQKGFLRIDVDWSENSLFDFPSIRSFSVKKITIEEIRN